MSRLFTFIGGNHGPWRVVSNRAIAGDLLPAATRVRIVAGNDRCTFALVWTTCQPLRAACTTAATWAGLRRTTF